MNESGPDMLAGGSKKVRNHQNTTEEQERKWSRYLILGIRVRVYFSPAVVFQTATRPKSGCRD
jgi:hypothetical protein